MVVSIEQAQKAVMIYLENEIARKATGLHKAASYYVMAVLQNKFPQIIKMLQDDKLISFLDIFDKNGNIIADVLYQNARHAMEKAQTVTIYGVTFNTSDVDKLYEYLKGV